MNSQICQALRFLLLASLLSLSQGEEVDTGEPLYLTPLIREGRHAQAREAALVSDFAPILSYSGFITVNEEYSSNLFFWYFPAKPSYNQTEDTYDEEVPVILWYDGGPGQSLFFSIFNQNGPYWGNLDGTNFTLNPHSWHKKFHMIYIDNPVEVGFSHTGSDQGYITTDEGAVKDMYQFLQQFFSMFPHLQRNPFYTAGVSYGGKYAVETAQLIHQRNLEEPAIRVNLTGVIVDSPMIDPYTQTYYAEFLFNAGLINEGARGDIARKEEDVRRLIDEEKFVEAAEVFQSFSLVLLNLTGYGPLAHIYKDQVVFSDMTPWVTSNLTRRALHVGSLPFSFNSFEQAMRMFGTILRSSKPKLDQLLQAGYRFLLSVGNMDGTTGHLGQRRMLQSLEWEGKEELVRGNRSIWRLEGSKGVAGYQIHSGRNATLAIVRNAGHSTILDKPEEALDLVTSFLTK